MNKLYTYKFNYYYDFRTIKANTPLSLDEDGLLWPGAGITIYRNSTTSTIHAEMKHIRTKQLDRNFVLIAYDGGLAVFRGTSVGITLKVAKYELKDKEGKPFGVWELIHIGEKRYIVVGRREFIPIEVVLTRQDKEVSVEFLEGEHVIIENDDDDFPHFDNLDDKSFAVVYESGPLLYTTTGRWEGSGKGSRLVFEKSEPLHLRLHFHGVAGLDANHYIITATGPVFNVSTSTATVRTWLITVNPDKSLDIQDHVNLPWTFSDNWFAMDNIDERNVVLCYTDNTDGGIRSVLVRYNNETNTISYGAQVTLQRGGAVVNHEHTDLAILSRNRYVVTWNDAQANAIVMVMVTRTWANDLVVTSPEYVLSRSTWRDPVNRFYFDVCAITDEHFMIVEGRENRGMIDTRCHLGATYPRFFGIAKEDGVLDKKNTFNGRRLGVVKVQLGGIVTLKKGVLTPGRSVYTNSRGELIQGRPYGYATRSFGSFYLYDDATNSIIDGRNILGIATTKKKIMLRYQ